METKNDLLEIVRSSENELPFVFIKTAVNDYKEKIQGLKEKYKQVIISFIIFVTLIIPSFFVLTAILLRKEELLIVPAYFILFFLIFSVFYNFIYIDKPFDKIVSIIWGKKIARINSTEKENLLEQLKGKDKLIIEMSERSSEWKDVAKTAKEVLDI